MLTDYYIRAKICPLYPSAAVLGTAILFVILTSLALIAGATTYLVIKLHGASYFLLENKYRVWLIKCQHIDNEIDSVLDKAKPRVIWGRKATVLLRILHLSSNVLLERLNRRLDCRMYIYWKLE